MEISAQQVKELREKTGAGMMDCKKALAESNGDVEKATLVLREKGIAKAASKEGRATSEGIIISVIHPGDKLGTMVEINCETDFVARTDKFRDFARQITTEIGPMSVNTVEELLDQKLNGKLVADVVKETIGSLGENMQLKRFVRFKTDDYVTAYIHPGDKLGVMVEISGGSASDDRFRTFARDIAMQVAATSPICVRREELDRTVLEKEREIYRQQAKNEGKPEKIIDKIADGKIEKFYSEVVLMEQLFVKDNEKTIGSLVKEVSAAIGKPITIKRFARFRLGE
ncbi:elongation factor Ts [candidate division GN15 bacterium]|uniref:Elongation factor Ts n=1 Tax=candidate division GN15 bacterium TaxID=2072418 RepID=A0A855X355_9BACT|nr:MAG: elongation factor Ts [candidate division GN15 bacterium]